ncbi:hypothetical protein PIB30_042739 [Stylosanthes scabra]|uniref:Uncharacterized protein n=1 Tax=Stylosanthes scabra TaxID=79078 RepID=A0ABU6RFP5_9FABA|nr:hypothetical protein [Stylosanthes scabra]
MSVRNHTPFFGTEIHASFEGNNTSFRKSQRNNLFHLDRRNFPKRGLLRRSVVSAKQGFPVSQAFRFPPFCCQNVNLLRRNLGSTSGSRLNCTREPFFRSKFLVNFDLSNLWSEGLMLFRASVYTAVVSGVCILAWLGRNKAKAYVEANLLPSVCAAVSEYIERDLQFGKVRRISPLSITLESCSFGPHKEEFSCGEAPMVKLRLHPFASLRSGKFVFDAVLSQPSVLVVQKKDYTWLGIPTPSEDGLQRHLSTEEGIDHRTRTRRIAREEAVARWTRERDDTAREAAQMGYFVLEPNCDDVKEIPNNLLEATDSKSFFCTNEGKHDHHCMDTGVDYNTKHAALEKSFGVRSFGFFSRVIKGHRKHTFKRKPNRKDVCASGIAVKRRILERSALAAHTWFQDQSPGKFGEPPSSSGSLPYTNHDMQLVKTVVEKNEESVVGGNDNQNGTQFRDLGIWSPSAIENINGDSDYLKFVRALNLQTRESKHENLQSSEDSVVPADTDNCTEKNEEFRLHAVDSQINDNVTGVQNSLVPEDLDSPKPRPELATCFQVPFEALIVKLGLHSFLRYIQESMSGFLSGPIEKLKSDVGVKVEDIVAEHVDDVDALQSEGLSKMLPVTLDSVHFRGATVMLLAYGDREAR